MGIRYSFDLGTSSIGWAVFELDDHTRRPSRLIDMGVRLFDDGRNPKTGESLGKDRRDPKSARRRRDRTIQRRAYLLAELENGGLLPLLGPNRDRIFALDPYPLRARGPVEKLDLHEFGRVLWHLNQRRGFKSNRKADAATGEDGKIAEAGKALRALLETEGYKTIGQFLAARQSAQASDARLPVRIRLHGEGAQAQYDFYPQRNMLEEEFDILWAAQAPHHSELTDSLKSRLRQAIFFQRPLKPILPGRCTFFPEEYRLSRSRELAQEFIILSQLNNLRIDAGDGERYLLQEERDVLAAPLLAGEKLTWTKVRKLLKIGSAARINLEFSGEKELIFNPIPSRFEGTKKKPGPFPEGWMKLSPEQRDAIVEKLEPAPIPGESLPAVLADDEIALWAQLELGLDADKAARLARVTVPDGHINISAKAARMIVPHLREPCESGELRTYDRAAKAAGLNHSDFEDGEFFDRLPPYNRIAAMQRHIGFGTGNPEDPPDRRFGKIANPTVHIALNQLRRVVNALIDRYGKPDEIVLEVARDLKQSRKQKEEEQKRNDANRKANDSRRKEMAEKGHIAGDERRIRDKLIRMRLWEELGKDPLDRFCPFTGEKISLAMLLSDQVEIEHILPFSRTMDDSLANKTVALVKANRLKRNLSPAEAADRHPAVFDRAGMASRARLLPKNKAWRFDDDAMERFENSERDFADRQLRATQYLSRLARGYLAKLFPARDQEDNWFSPVWVVTGQLTSKLRHQWGLNLGDHNRKSRDDHRHHAIDAAVIGVTDRSLLQKVSTIAGREEERGTDVDRLIAGLEEPYSRYIDQVQERVRTLLVAPRPDHGQATPDDPRSTSGKLHEETYYGLVRDLPQNADDLARGNVVRRKPVSDLTPKDIDQIRDRWIRVTLKEILKEAGHDKKALSQALTEWSNRSHLDSKGGRHPNPKRVRVLKPEAALAPVFDKKGQPYKYVVPAENAFIDIVETQEGEWKGVTVDIYAANTGNSEGWMSVYPEAKFIMRLHKGDTLQLIDDDGENRVKILKQIKPSANQLILSNINEGGTLQKRHDDKEDSFRFDYATISKLKSRKARRVRFTPAGRMKIVPYGKL